MPTAATAIEGRYHLAILPSLGTALEAAASSSVAISPIAIALRDVVDVVKSLWRSSGVNREKGIAVDVDVCSFGSIGVMTEVDIVMVLFKCRISSWLMLDALAKNGDRVKCLECNV